MEIHLGVSQAALHVAKEEANAVRAQLAKSDAMVAGKMNSMKASYSDFYYSYFDIFLVL